MFKDRELDKNNNNNDIWMTYQTNNDKKVLIPSYHHHYSMIHLFLSTSWQSELLIWLVMYLLKYCSYLSYLEFEALSSYSFSASPLTLIFSPAVSVHIWRSWELHSWQSSNWMHSLSSITNFWRLKLCDSHVKSDICLLLPILVRI
jgi:hypothetical protein